eukprot:TRINITY_DN4593_c2_g1_i1.p1 TRINITY_DN4593_c2_g1~~TRINITY_DN4593_c2_g1_i1.p1  ORF type:complete len:527 (-),score=139.73 TRINITY_DN4593_c2_g1_i1:52-1545(-)
MAHNTLLRENLVELLAQLTPEEAVALIEKEKYEAINPPEWKLNLALDPTTPVPCDPLTQEIVQMQSRAHMLFMMLQLLSKEACAEAIAPVAPTDDGGWRRRGSSSTDDDDDQDDLGEEGEEEEERVTDPMTSAQGSKESLLEETTGNAEDDDDESSSEVDADALLAEVDQILNEKKPSSDEDLLNVFALAAAPTTPAEELRQAIPPWRDGSAAAQRFDSFCSLSAAGRPSEAAGLWRFENFHEVVINACEAEQPELVRESALATMAALANRDENKQPMWDDPRVLKVLVIGASAMVSIRKPVKVIKEADDPNDDFAAVPEEKKDILSAPAKMTPSTPPVEYVTELKHQSMQLRAHALSALYGLAGTSNEIRHALWHDRRVSSALLDAISKSGPQKVVAATVLCRLSGCEANQEPMFESGVAEKLEAVMSEPTADPHFVKVCELARNRVLGIQDEPPKPATERYKDSPEGTPRSANDRKSKSRRSKDSKDKVKEKKKR